MKQHRERQGLTQWDLAQKSGVGVNTIRKIEQGKAGKIHAGTRRLLADALRLGPIQETRVFGELT